MALLWYLWYVCTGTSNTYSRVVGRACPKASGQGRSILGDSYKLSFTADAIFTPIHLGA